MKLTDLNQWDIEVSPKMYTVLANIFEVLGIPAPSSVTYADMEKVFFQMKTVMKYHSNTQGETNFKISDFKLKPARTKFEKTSSLETKISNALIISNLGIFRYQLKNIFQKNNIETKATETLYTGLSEYLKKLYDVVVIDISDNFDEAIEIIEEIKRTAKLNNTKTRIFILAPVMKSDEKLKFLLRGVEKIIDKQHNWYFEIEEILNSRVPHHEKHFIHQLQH